MFSLTTLVLFSGACLALTITPGPDMLLIASRSISQGRSAGFASLAGIQVGTYGHALAAAFGLSQLFLAVPMAYDAVRFAGAAYLLYLAWKTFRADATVMSPVSVPHPFCARMSRLTRSAHKLRSTIGQNRTADKGLFAVLR